MRLEAVQPHRLAKGEVEEQSSGKENFTVHHHCNPFIRMQLDNITAAMSRCSLVKSAMGEKLKLN